MKKLLQLDKLDGDRKGVVRTIDAKGELVVSLYDTFPAHILELKLVPKREKGGVQRKI